MLSRGGAGSADEADEGRKWKCCGTAFDRAAKGSWATAGGMASDFDGLKWEEEED